MNSNTQENPDQTRLALIFPPAMHPSSPPLGLASLKAFLQSGGYRGSVKLFDLNLAHTLQVLRWLSDGRLKMSLSKMSHEPTASRVLQVCRFFSSKGGLESFLDLSSYNANASFYVNFETVLNGLFENFARRIVTGLPLPPLVKSYFKELLDPVLAYGPTLAGLSILFSQQLYFTLAIARLLKEAGSKVVVGGATLSVMPDAEKLLLEPIVTKVGSERQKVDVSRFVDYLILGEGETGLSALVECEGSKSPQKGEPARGGEKDRLEDLLKVPGLVYRMGDHLISNPPEMVADLNRLPLPDFSDFSLSDYLSPLPVLPYLSARGCFWGRCAFCTHQKTYMAYREESVERTVGRLSELKERYNVGHFNLVDEMIHPNRFSLLSSAIIRSGLKINYSAYAKPTGRFDASLLKRLFRSGARVLMWGVESGSQRVLDSMKKGTRVVEMERVLHEAGEAGIWNLIFMMFGFPGETRFEWEESLDFLEKSRKSVDALSKSRFILLAGSEVYKAPRDFGIQRVLSRSGQDPISVAYDYEVDRGLGREEAEKLFDKILPKLGEYGRSPYFGQFRDHLLIYASSAGADQY